MPENEVVVRDSGSSGYPIGTRAEVIARNLDPKVVPTCSEHIPGLNAGCVYFNHKTRRCIFSKFRNAEAGPEMIGQYKKLPSGAEQGFIMPCYLWMSNEFDFWQQRHMTGVQYSRFYNVGESITRKVRQPRHPKADPECHRCRKGDCNLTDLVQITDEITAFQRPSEYPEGIFPFTEVDEPAADIALEHAAENQPKTGGQLEDLVAQRRKVRQITERVSGTTGT